MRTTTTVRNNRIFANIGGKRIVISPHQTEVFESSASKIEAVQRKLRNAVADRFERNKKEVLAQYRRGIGASDLSLSKDEKFAKQFRQLLLEAAVIGGNRGLRKIKAKDAYAIFEEDETAFANIPQEDVKQASEIPFSDVEGDIGIWKKWVKAIPGDQFGGTSEFRQATMSYQLAEGIGTDMRAATMVGKPAGSVLRITSDRGLESVARISRVGDDLVVNTISTAPWNIKGLPQANRVGGYGTKMIDDIAGRALADPTIKSLKLNPIRDAEGFYEKLGFKQVSSGGTRHKYVAMNRSEMEAFRKKYSGTAPFKLFDSADPNVMDWVNNNSAKMITNIDNVTMLNARAVISRGVEGNLTNREISKRLTEKFDSWGARYPGKQSRAEMVARTETAKAVNVGTVEGYAQSGVVDNVRVIDNEVAHSCVYCRAANDQIWTIEYARNHEVQHPNCTRVFSPVIRGDVASPRRNVPTSDDEYLQIQEMNRHLKDGNFTSGNFDYYSRRNKTFEDYALGNATTVADMKRVIVDSEIWRSYGMYSDDCIRLRTAMADVVGNDLTREVGMKVVSVSQEYKNAVNAVDKLIYNTIPGDKFTVYRGVAVDGRAVNNVMFAKKGDVLEFNTNVLSSWTTDRTTAEMYATARDYGIVIKQEVKKSEVFMNYLQNGYYGENEMVIKSATGVARVTGENVAAFRKGKNVFGRRGKPEWLES